MRVLQHIAMFVLDKFTDKDIKALQDQVAKMEKRIPGIICASFSANQTDYYKVSDYIYKNAQ